MSWISGSGSLRPNAADSSIDRQLGHGQAQGLRELSHDQLGDQGLGPLPRPAELDHEQAAAVGVDHRGQRAPLAEGLHVAGRLVARERLHGTSIAAHGFLRRTSSRGADHGYGLISISAGSATRGPTPLGHMYSKIGP